MYKIRVGRNRWYANVGPDRENPVHDYFFFDFACVPSTFKRSYFISGGRREIADFSRKKMRIRIIIETIISPQMSTVRKNYSERE